MRQFLGVLIICLLNNGAEAERMKHDAPLTKPDSDWAGAEDAGEATHVLLFTDTRPVMSAPDFCSFDSNVSI